MCLGDEGKPEQSYKIYWQRRRDGVGGVGVLVKMSWVKNVVEVRHVGERMMLVNLAMRKDMLQVVAAYAPQGGRSQEETDTFWEE